MHDEQRVGDMADEVLAHQARARAERTEETLEGALQVVLETEAGRQLGELRDGPHRDKRAKQWQEDLPQKRVKEQKRVKDKEQKRVEEQKRAEERSRAHRDAAWKRFMRKELQELELRKDGQLGRLLGEPLPGEPPAALRRLASEDRRQAEEGLVALMSNGKMSYKHLEELSERDMPSRSAASRLRTRWLKERRLDE
jgi:hypothetical protein